MKMEVKMMMTATMVVMMMIRGRRREALHCVAAASCRLGAGASQR